MFDEIPDYDDPERHEALGRLLQFIEVPIDVFDANAATICELAAAGKRAEGRALGAVANCGCTLHFPSAIGPDARAEAYEQPRARRYLMAWAVREVLRGATIALVATAARSARPLECAVFEAARACLKPA